MERAERGNALIFMLAFMALAVPLIMGALGLASTLSIDSRIKNQILKSTYSSSAGAEHAVYRLVYESGFAGSIPTGGSVNYSVNMNGSPVNITVYKVSDLPQSAVPPTTQNAAKFQVTKSVSPTTAPSGVPTTFTYTITVTNWTDSEKKLNILRDTLPSGFTYVPGSTSGMTTQNPTIAAGNLKWDQLNVDLQPGEARQLIFQAQATPTDGVYCNEAWTEPDGKSNGTGKTAKGKVGNPAGSTCVGVVALISKTANPNVIPANSISVVTYTITITNDGGGDITLTQLKDVLPPGFTYVTGSAVGLTTSNPSIGGTTQQELTWNFTPSIVIPSGETVILSFKASANVAPGQYWNEAWAKLQELSDPVTTWPTAMVEARSPFKIVATDNKSTVFATVLIGTSGSSLATWTIK